MSYTIRGVVTSLDVALVLSAEHASNRLPPEVGTLGLDPGILESHVAWDAGAREVAEALAERFAVPLHAGEWTRLLVDLNRSPGTPQVVPEVAFGVVVPGNARLDPEARAARVERWHAPHWARVRAAVAARIDRGPVLHLAVHSFTPELHGKRREVELGVLFDPTRALETRVAEVLLRELRVRGFDARANEPYDGREDALPTALRREMPSDRYAGIELEVSHALLGALARVSAAAAESLARVGIRAR